MDNNCVYKLVKQQHMSENNDQRDHRSGYPLQSVSENPNERRHRQSLGNTSKDVFIKKTYSQYYGNSSYRNSVNSDNLNPKIPRVIFEVIAEKTRQQNYIRIRSQKQFNRKRSLFNPNRRSLLQSRSKHGDFIQEENQPIQKPQPTGNMRRSIAALRLPEFETKLSLKHKITCPICQVQGSKKQFVTICNNQCEHKYCRSCMHQYVIYKIKMFQKVTCPDQFCKVTLKHSSQLYAELPIDTRERFKKTLQYDEVMHSDSKRICPNEECNGVLDISNPERNPRCEICRIVYCRKCFFPNHAGQCDPFQLRFFQETLNYRQCSNCKSVIEKNQGCNHMTCRCGYQFCYLCGVKWTNAHMCQQLQLIDEPYIPDRWQCCCFQCNECDFCEPLDYFCECMCFDEWAICEPRPIRWFFKLLIILIVMIIGVPMWIFYLLFHLFITFFMGIFVGLFVLPCQPLCEQGNCLWIMLGIVFFPITIVILIAMGMKQTFFNHQVFEDFMDELSLPIDVINQIIEL